MRPGGARGAVRSTRARVAIAIAIAGAALGCAPAEELERAAAVAEEPLGEPMDGFPTWEERVVHVWTNRARAAPADDLASCATCAERACYTPQPPLAWTHGLARAARFHSENLQRGGCSLQHDSPCTLVSGIGTSFTPGPCNGAPSCACSSGSASCGSVGTSTWDRLAAFGYGGGSRGENIAAGSSDPVSTFYQWLHERDTSSACGFRGSNGHRYSILNGAYRGIGVGKASAGNVWTQDFTSLGAPTGIVQGAHYPRTGTTIAFRANWYATAAPTSAEVNVDGTCHAMTLERGSGTNGTYLASVALAAGCHRYVFRFESSAGTFTYPSTGAYGVGCPTDWDASAAPPACGCVPMCSGRACGPDGCGGSCGSCPAGESCSAGGACVCGGGTTRCAGTCVDTGSSSAHCGTCGHACAAGETCAAGACVAPPRDAGPPPIDAGRDAGATPADAGAMSADAGAMSADAGAVPADAGAMSADAGAMSADAGAMPADAGAMSADAGTSDDAGPTGDSSTIDDGSLGDASATADDASLVGDVDAGPSDAIVGGCACRAPGGGGGDRGAPGALAMLALVALGLRRRRR